MNPLSSHLIHKKIFFKYINVVNVSIWKRDFDRSDFYLTHFKPKSIFYTPRKYQKGRHFLMFSGSIEVKHWLKMG